jgi:hypothetical protein
MDEVRPKSWADGASYIVQWGIRFLPILERGGIPRAKAEVRLTRTEEQHFSERVGYRILRRPRSTSCTGGSKTPLPRISGAPPFGICSLLSL